MDLFLQAQRIMPGFFCLGTAPNMMSILYVEPINDVSITVHAKIHTACF